ncbi:MAG: hypothetical protein DSY89_07670 [Deltaproteobacteria bacterium]|nr:MAG: hypothetical protein DSY89_07670 [Deltaproteobacteria bacterium]
MELNPIALHIKGAARPEGQGSRPDTGTHGREKPGRNRSLILCRACGRAITHERERMTVQGSHLHTFANPHGRVFEIGCFRTAAGCGYSGALTAEFTWFAGYQWKIAVCAGCLTHLGWLFVSAGSRFTGLILNRLAQDNR